MSSEQHISAIRRKTQVGLHEHRVRAMSVQKAFRVSVAKVADELYDMAMSAIGITLETREAEACADLFDPASLLILLDGPARRRGAVVLDPALVGAMIQQQTMGMVMPIPEGAEPRALTETDAAPAVTETEASE